MLATPPENEKYRILSVSCRKFAFRRDRGSLLGISHSKLFYSEYISRTEENTIRLGVVAFLIVATS